MTNGVRYIGKALRESQEEAKIVILQALSNLLRLKVCASVSLKINLFKICLIRHLVLPLIFMCLNLNESSIC